MDVAIVIQKMVAAHFGTCNWMADSWLLLSRAKLELNWFICSKTAFVIYFAWILYYIPSFWPFDFGSDGLGEIYFIPFIKCSHYLHCYNSGGNYTDTLFFGSVCCTWNYLLSLLQLIRASEKVFTCEKVFGFNWYFDLSRIKFRFTYILINIFAQKSVDMEHKVGKNVYQI